jgi:putative membrane protein
MSQQTPLQESISATDVTRRTRLADERTYLAWIRTGLSCFAVGLAAGKVVPALTHEPRWPYEVLGVGFAITGVAVVAYGLVRHRSVGLALSRSEDVKVSGMALAILVGVLALLGLALLGIVISP